MYNPKRRDFLLGTGSAAIAVFDGLSSRLSTAFLGGLAGVVASPRTSSAQDMTPEQMQEYLKEFYGRVQAETYSREKHALKGPRCTPERAILFEGVIDGERVLVQVEAPLKGAEFFQGRPVGTDEYSVYMGFQPIGAKTVVDPIPKYPGHEQKYTTYISIDDFGLNLDVTHPRAYVRFGDVDNLEEGKLEKGGYELTKRYMPAEGCHSEGGRLGVCVEGYAAYSPNQGKPVFQGDYYKKIGYDNLKKRMDARLKQTNKKYKRYLKAAIKTHMARRKKQAC